MSDYSELKRLAEAALNDNGDYVALNDYGMAVPPAVVLDLIAELEILKYDCKVANSCVNAEKKESKRIIDENESLKKDAARYRYVRNCLHRETDILVTSKKAAHAYGDLGVYSCSVLDEIIDEAILKEDNK